MISYSKKGKNEKLIVQFLKQIAKVATYEAGSEQDVIDNQKTNQPTNQTNNSKKKKKTSSKNKKGIKKKNKKKKKKKNEDTREHVYNVDVTKSLDMAIDHPEEDQSHYPAVVTNLKPGAKLNSLG